MVNCILLALNTPLPQHDKSDLNIRLVSNVYDENTILDCCSYSKLLQHAVSPFPFTDLIQIRILSSQHLTANRFSFVVSNIIFYTSFNGCENIKMSAF